MCNCLSALGTWVEGTSYVAPVVGQIRFVIFPHFLCRNSHIPIEGILHKNRVSGEAKICIVHTKNPKNNSEWPYKQKKRPKPNFGYTSLCPGTFHVIFAVAMLNP